MYKKYLFIDRDETLATLSGDGKNWICRPRVIPSLCKLIESGFALVLFIEEPASEVADVRQTALRELFDSQGVIFEAVLACRHAVGSDCLCRKPHLALLRPWLTSNQLDWQRSYFIGDEAIDLRLAENAGLKSIQYHAKNRGWAEITKFLLGQNRQAKVQRKTKETNIQVEIDLDQSGVIKIATGLGYFDHMLDQLAKHGGFNLALAVEGDLEIDEHHTVEDTALALGEAFRKALGDKLGIGRYGFVVPMDEAESRVSIDLSGRAYLNFSGSFNREYVGELPTELVAHFYRSFSDTLGATLHIEVTGQNAHHMVESTFKGLGRALRMAISQNGSMELPSTKGSL